MKPRREGQGFMKKDQMPYLLYVCSIADTELLGRRVEANDTRPGTCARRQRGTGKRSIAVGVKRNAAGSIGQRTIAKGRYALPVGGSARGGRVYNPHQRALIILESAADNLRDGQSLGQHCYIGGYACAFADREGRARHLQQAIKLTKRLAGSVNHQRVALIKAVLRREANHNTSVPLLQHKVARVQVFAQTVGDDHAGDLRRPKRSCTAASKAATQRINRHLWQYGSRA